MNVVLRLLRSAMYLLLTVLSLQSLPSLRAATPANSGPVVRSHQAVANAKDDDDDDDEEEDDDDGKEGEK